jgi:hypothetical protein
MSGNRLFFGWWVLFGIFSLYTALCGIQIYTLPLLYPELMREFGWSTEKVTRAATVFFLTGAIITPFVSSLFDRFSARTFMIAGAIATIIGLFSYSSLKSYLPVFEMLIGLACIVAFLVLFLFRMRRNILQKAQPALS